MFHDPAPLPIFFLFSIVIGAMVLWIYCLIDAIRNDFEKETQKVIWIILLVTVPVIGVVLYLLMGREQQIDGPSDEL
jgi:hypothetical protein